MVRTSTWTGQDCEVGSILRIGSQGWNIRAAAVTTRLWLLRSEVINPAFSCAVLQLGSMAGRFNISPAGCMDGGVHIVQAATLYKRLSGCWPHAMPTLYPKAHAMAWPAVDSCEDTVLRLDCCDPRFSCPVLLCRRLAALQADPTCLLLAGCMDGSVHILHAATGQLLTSAKPHSKYVVAADWAPVLVKPTSMLLQQQQQQQQHQQEEKQQGQGMQQCENGEQLLATASYDSSCCLLRLVGGSGGSNGIEQQLSMEVVQQVKGALCGVKASALVI